ncbi:arylsulfotransferase protein [Purpureocillium lavendulum]|uniref:Arylsulfotransferase protein n=1 Tax=Purpureocillium lavendulum TaxID=1247861 RepID=A0AB34FJ45_9HYPO|nr:arylsulfotransferase protein [Purpureocillium lavendulum]
MEKITSLTVGRVSGLIALGNTIVAFTVPLLLAILLVRHYDTSISAATWSVLGRQLHSTPWPSFFRADSVVTKHVHWTVSTAAYLKLALALLGVVCSVVTPLGLGDQIRSASNRDAPFDYVPDLSSFGISTMNRPDMPLSRDCIITSAFCPGAIVPGSVINQDGGNVSANPTHTATTRVPGNITTMFRSASSNSTVASILDIHYRSWMPYTSEYFDEHKPYVRGQFVHLDYLLTRDSIVLVEGLIADMKSGGVGFRNHSAPQGLPLGGEWDEDILWIEPEISCVNTNLSYELILADARNPHNFSVPIRSIGLVDDGGLSNLRLGNPYTNWPNLTYASPDVRLRASRSAWLNNFLTAFTYNMTNATTAEFGLNVTEGHRYPIKDIPTFISAQGVQTTSLGGRLLNLPFVTTTRDGWSIGNRTITSVKDDPYWFAVGLFTELDGRCSGRYNDASLTMDHNVECGYLFAAPSRVDGGEPLFQEPGSKWKMPIYTCAGAVKATVKTVSFTTNGTVSLASLTVREVKDKQYKSPADYPLWAMEDWWHSGYEGAYAAPLWGIVDGSYQGTPGYNFSRAPSLYLPYTYYDLTWKGNTGPLDMLAGPVAPYGILGQVLSDVFSDYALNKNIPRYSGTDSGALRTKWRKLSQKPEDVETLLRLVWTDMMASATVGTVGTTVGGNKSVRRSQETKATDGALSRRVTIFERSVTYDMRYAIPALLFLASWALLLLAASITATRNGHLLQRLKQLLNHTSVGRVAIGMADKGNRDLLRLSTRDWLDAVGHIPLRLWMDPESYDEVEQHLARMSPREGNDARSKLVPQSDDT